MGKRCLEDSGKSNVAELSTVALRPPQSPRANQSSFLDVEVLSVFRLLKRCRNLDACKCRRSRRSCSLSSGGFKWTGFIKSKVRKVAFSSHHMVRCRPCKSQRGSQRTPKLLPRRVVDSSSASDLKSGIFRVSLPLATQSKNNLPRGLTGGDDSCPQLSLWWGEEVPAARSSRRTQVGSKLPMAVPTPIRVLVWFSSTWTSTRPPIQQHLVKIGGSQQHRSSKQVRVCAFAATRTWGCRFHMISFIEASDRPCLDRVPHVRNCSSSLKGLPYPECN